MATALKQEFDYYLSHQDELVQKYNGKFIVIKDGKVIGDYPTEIGAITETLKSHPLGTFLVQQVSPGTSAYTQTFHSRAVFS